MQKLTRIYVGNYGYASAWYDGITFDLTDPATGEAANTIINLENGGGKTSLLGFIFSCFDTGMDRFLQHIQDKKARFSEYFSKDGLPGVALLEWDMPSRTVNGLPYKLVVGQVVAHKTQSDADELDRIFFSFEVSATLGLTSVPVPKLNENPATTMAEFTRWLHQIQKDHPDVYLTRVQTDWQRNLRDERHIDVDMLKMQVNFSAQEGGMDAGFLTFGSESEFLQKFFFLTVDTDRADAVRATVVGACDKLRKKPFFEKRLAQLTLVQSALQQFSQAATHYSLELEGQKKALAHGGGLVLSLTARSRQRAADCAIASADAAEQDALATEAQHLVARERTELRHWMGAQHAWSLKQAHDKLGTAKKEKTASERALYLTKAAMLQADILAISAQIDALTITAHAADDGLKPLEDRVNAQGALLRRKLINEENTLRTRLAAAQEEAVQLTLSVSTAKEQLKGLGAVASQLEKDHACRQSEEQLYIRAKTALRQRALLADGDESALDGAARYERVSDALQDDSVRLRAQHQELLAAQQSVRLTVKATSAQVQQQRTEQEKAQFFVGAADSERETLSQLAALRDAAQTEIADPDSNALPMALSSIITSAQSDIAACNVRIADLCVSRDSIDDTGVSGAKDVTDVIAALKAAGIKSACAYNTYIAQALPDVDIARALIASNPARFLGVAIAEAEFQKAKTVSLGRLPLFRPVVVSLAALEPEPAVSHAFVIPAGNDASFNLAAASELTDTLNSRFDAEEERLYAASTRLAEATSAKARLSTYRENFSLEVVASARTRALQLAQELVENLEFIREKEQKDAEIEQEAKEKLDKAQAIELKAAQERNKAKELSQFFTEYEQGRPTRLLQITQLLQCLQDESAKRISTENFIQQCEAKHQALFKANVLLESKADELGRERGALKYYDKAYPAQTELTRDPSDLMTLRKVYGDAVAMYELNARNRVGVAHEKLTTARGILLEKTGQFTKKFTGVTNVDLRPYAHLDFELAAQKAKLIIDTCTEQTARCEKALGTVEGLAQAFSAAYDGAAIELPAEGAWDDLTLAQKADELRLLIQDSSESAREAQEHAIKAHSLAKQAQRDTKEAASFALNLRSVMDLPELPDDAPVALVLDLSAQVTDVVTQFTVQRKQTESARVKAVRRFDVVKATAASPRLHEVDPDVARQLQQNDFEAACVDSERILSGLVDRINTTQGNLDSLSSDFDACVEEMYNLSLQGIGLLQSAMTNKKVPDDAPYVGGKSVLKMRANFTSITPEVKRAHLRAYLDSIIDTHVIPARGADLLAAAVLRLYGKPLGLQILKMVVDESLQYVAVDRIHNSGGEGVVMAMFLYLVINQIRAESLAKLHKAGGGPLILDNPFAKATTPALWKAQRLLAKAMGVQLIFATAVADYNTVGEFSRFIRLRNIGKNSKTGRSHLEAADFKLRDEIAA